MATGRENVDTITSDGWDDVLQEKTSTSQNVLRKAGFDETFSSKSRREDTTLLVGDKRMYVSSAVLSLASPVFSELFEGKEGNELEFELPGKKYEDILEFIQCLYPNITKDITQENVFVVQPLATEYKVKFLEEKCYTFLYHDINEDTSLETICMYLWKISEFGLSEELQDKCIQQALKEDFQELCDTEDEYPIPSDAKIQIQKGEIDKLNETVSKLREEKEKLKEILKKGDMNEIWFCEDDDYGEVPCLNDYRASYLDHTVNVDFKDSESTKVSVHGIDWKMQLKKTEQGSISMYLYSDSQIQCNGWFCRVYAKFCLRRVKGTDGDVKKRIDHIFSAGGGGYGYRLFINASVNLKEDGFIDNSEMLHFQIKFLVEKPTFFGIRK